MLSLKNNITLFFLLISYPVSEQGIEFEWEVENVIITEPEMANFNPVYENTAEWEGGYQANSADKANYNSLGQLVGTNYGISAVAYEGWIGRPPTIEDMKNITPAISKEILKKKYWDNISGDSIKSQAVAEIIFGTFIGNMVKTNQVVKQALSDVGRPVESVKNPYSKEVITQINKANPQELFYAIKNAQMQLIIEPMRVSASPFYAGWNRKVSSYEYEGPKKKWIIVLVGITLLTVSGYVMIKKGYLNKPLKKIGIKNIKI